MKHWGIEESDEMAFDDSGNGIEMLGRAQYSFAMANVKESIKQILKYMITSNNDGGGLRSH